MGKLYHKYFSLYTVVILLILNTELGLIWITPWPYEKELFLNFAKIRNSRNSKNSVWERNFFPRQALPNFFFALYSHYTGYTQYRVWFDLENSLTRWKRNFFEILKNSHFAKFTKLRMKTNFFPRQVIPTTFSLCPLITLVILHTEFG